MNPFVPVYQQQASHKKWHPIARDWFGQPARHRAEFLLELDRDVLHFHFRSDKDPECDPGHQAGDFIEGLWEQDVAELFVMGPSGYQEFNVSPRGAWWSAIFSAYRQREAEARCPSASVSADRQTGLWSVRLSVALRDIAVLPEARLDQAKLCVTAILNPSQPEYLCSGHEKGGQPDFHKKENFLPAALL